MSEPTFPTPSAPNNSSCTDVLDLSIVQYDCSLELGHDGVHKHLLPEESWEPIAVDTDADGEIIWDTVKHVQWTQAAPAPPTEYISPGEPGDDESSEFVCDRCGKQLTWDTYLPHREAHAVLDA